MASSTGASTAHTASINTRLRRNRIVSRARGDHDGERGAVWPGRSKTFGSCNSCMIDLLRHLRHHGDARPRNDEILELRERALRHVNGVAGLQIHVFGKLGLLQHLLDVYLLD